MKLWFHKVSRAGKVGLVADDEEGWALLARMGDGECLQLEVVRPRSVPMHRMYFGICRQIGLNQDPPRSEDSIDQELRILAGHYDVIRVGHLRLPWWFGAVARLLESKGRVGRWLTKRLRAHFKQHRVLVPRRIAFAKLTHDEWMQLWPSLELAIYERFGEGYLQEQAA